MNKRSQITLYLILVLIIVGIAGFYLFQLSSTTERASGMERTISTTGTVNLDYLDEYMPSCMLDHARQGYYDLADTGGMFNPTNFIEKDGQKIGLYTVNGVSQGITLEKLAENLLQYIQQNISARCRDPEGLVGAQLKIVDVSPVILNGNDVFLSYSVKVQVIRADSRIVEKTYEYSITDDRMKKSYNIIAPAIGTTGSTNPGIDLTDLLNNPNSNLVIYLDFQDDVQIIKILDQSDGSWQYSAAFN